MQMNWEDIRFFLAIQRGRTLSAAARQLGVNQTTVARRLAALERDLGTRLFDRVDRNHVATSAGESLLAHAERVEEEALALEHAVNDGNSALSGAVRLTAVPSFVVNFLLPCLGQFRRRYPDILLELIDASGNLSLTQREADIAIRLARPDAGGTRVLVRKMADMGYAVYGAKSLLNGRSSLELTHLPWVIYDDSFAHLPEAQWFVRNIKGVEPVLRTNDDVALDAAVRQGLGVGVLACYMADHDKAFVRLSGPSPLFSREIWLLVHRELRRVARVQALVDWLSETLAAKRAILSGKECEEGLPSSSKIRW
jgi:DNA-binding transcriptional LysR family regulator